MVKEHGAFASMVQHMQISKRNSAHNMIQDKYDIIISIEEVFVKLNSFLITDLNNQEEKAHSCTIKDTVIILANKYTE